MHKDFTGLIYIKRPNFDFLQKANGIIRVLEREQRESEGYETLNNVKADKVQGHIESIQGTVRSTHYQVSTAKEERRKSKRNIAREYRS